MLKSVKRISLLVLSLGSGGLAGELLFLQGWTSPSNAIAISVGIYVFVGLAWSLGSYAQVSRYPDLEARWVVNGRNQKEVRISNPNDNRLEVVAYNKGSKAASFPHITFMIPENHKEIFKCHIEGGQHLREFIEDLPKTGKIRQIEWNPQWKEVVHQNGGAHSMGYLSFSFPKGFKGFPKQGEYRICYRSEAVDMRRKASELIIRWDA